MVMVPARHRLAGRTSVRARELLDEPLLGATTGDPVWNAFWELRAHRGGGAAPVVSRSNSLLEELPKVATGAGVVITVAYARWIPFPGVRLIPIVDVPPNEVAVGWRGCRESALVRSFVDIARTIRDSRPHADLTRARNSAAWSGP
ncbi:hypothetical protein EBN03_31305 [Nocardia stercoris]|uniref:LysR substrate-binding domain-containing protein n=2 Tax=Nocardia stercoris TaxID=2483361 RepID=A0A3M2KXE3_9NOCA|nr:hypothetical protein EBN03_31305 [Nocardia stercoris]